MQEQTPVNIEAIVEKAVTSAIKAVRAEDDLRAQAAAAAVEEAETERLAAEKAQAERDANRPPRRLNFNTDEMAEAAEKFRQGSTVRVRGHRGVKLYGWREGDDKGAPAPYINLRPDDEADVPVFANAQNNQTSRELAHLHLAGFFEPV